VRRDRALVLSKHHGSGNDFLVVLAGFATGGQSGADLSSEEVRALCSRHRGVGADGLIIGTPGRDGAQLEMLLFNADGSTAEMSGNGIRCLVQAAVTKGAAPEGVVVVDTGGGRRRVAYRDAGDGLGFAEVDMGRFSVSETLDPHGRPVSLAGAGAVSRACAVSVGNPHVVLLQGESRPDLEQCGPLIEASVPGGANVELVQLRTSGELSMEVWERGVGMTEACGTGAVAAAAAARTWGLVDSVVDVTTAGGTLRVTLASDSATLAGPTRFVADVTVDTGHLQGLVTDRIEEPAPAP